MRAVLFDVDGTLINTWDLYIEAYLRALTPHFGGRPTLEDLRGLHPTSELRLMEQVAGAESPAAHASFLELYGALHEALFRGVYGGVPKMLATLRVGGVRLGIVTGKSRGAWEHTPARAELGVFEAVVFDDDVAEPKPHPEGLARALAMLGEKPEAALYVGDSVSDASAAAAAGIPFAAALWAKVGEDTGAFLDRAREAGVRHVLAEPADLPRALGLDLPGEG